VASGEFVNGANLSLRLASKATSAAIERLAACDRRHAATADQWDTNSWLLNTPAGTIDLQTGEMHAHCRMDFITKMTSVGPSGACPQWHVFLNHVTNGDLELQAFLQRIIGYALTGSTQENVLFFLFGTGANGKSVFLSTISGILGDYSKTAPASSFTASTTEQHPTDLAGLRGARLVTAVETEDGARWAEAKIKSLTGGEKIAARLMRCDFFEYVPEFKLFIAGNHKPSLRSVDEAMRRRHLLVPFTVTIPPEKRDPRLAEKLRAEFPGILKWAVDGCLEWQRSGLKPPSAVLKATRDYFSAEDTLGAWLEDRCIRGMDYWACGAELFSDYRSWSTPSGEPPLSQRRFSQSLESRGFTPVRTSSARGFRGIQLRSPVTRMTHSPVISVIYPRGRPK
jgi:putative DNA primase/helicase